MHVGPAQRGVKNLLILDGCWWRWLRSSVRACQNRCKRAHAHGSWAHIFHCIISGDKSHVCSQAHARTQNKKKSLCENPSAPATQHKLTRFTHAPAPARIYCIILCTRCGCCCDATYATAHTHRRCVCVDEHHHCARTHFHTFHARMRRVGGGGGVGCV